MSLSLPVLILLVAASPSQTSAEPLTPTQAERAKRGLLPRKARPSRVTYLEGAARRRGEVRAFPELAAAPIVEEEGEDAAASSEATPVQAEAQQVAGVGPEAKAEGVEKAEGVGDSEGVVKDEGVAKVEGASGSGSGSVTGGNPTMRWGDPAAEEAADRARDDEAVSAAFVSERWVDGRGRVMERRMDRSLRVLSVRVVAMVDALPVLDSRRLADGRIADRVELEGTFLDVVRDPVGRFLTARAAPGPVTE